MIDVHYDDPKQAQVAELILQHVGFARNLARRYYYDHRALHIDQEELESAAFLGLCDCARRFDSTRQENFHTYAYFRIRGAIKDAVRYELRQRFVNKKPLPMPDLPEPPEPPSTELAEDSPASSFATELDDLGTLIYLIADLNIKLMISKKSGTAQMAYLSEENPEEEAVLQNTLLYLKKIVNDLPPAQRRIVELHYFHGYSLHEMQRAFEGSSISWLSRQHNLAVDKIKHAMEKAQDARQAA